MLLYTQINKLAAIRSIRCAQRHFQRNKSVLYDIIKIKEAKPKEVVDYHHRKRRRTCYWSGNNNNGSLGETKERELKGGHFR